MTGMRGFYMRAELLRMQEALDRNLGPVLHGLAQQVQDEVRGCSCTQMGAIWGQPARSTDEDCPLHGRRARRRAAWLRVPRVVRRAHRGRWPAAGL